MDPAADRGEPRRSRVSGAFDEDLREGDRQAREKRPALGV